MHRKSRYTRKQFRNTNNNRMRNSDDRSSCLLLRILQETTGPNFAVCVEREKWRRSSSWFTSIPEKKLSCTSYKETRALLHRIDSRADKNEVKNTARPWIYLNQFITALKTNNRKRNNQHLRLPHDLFVKTELQLYMSATSTVSEFMADYSLSTLAVGLVPTTTHCESYCVDVAAKNKPQRLYTHADPTLHVNYDQNSGNVVLCLWLSAEEHTADEFRHVLYMTLYAHMLQTWTRVVTTQKLYIRYLYILQLDRRSKRLRVHIYHYNPNAMFNANNKYFKCAASKMKPALLLASRIENEIRAQQQQSLFSNALIAPPPSPVS